MRRASSRFYCSSSSKVIGGRGSSEVAVDCFHDLEGILRRAEKRRDRSSATTLFTLLLRQCENARSVDHGRRVHRSIERLGLSSNVLLANLLIQMYGRCGKLETAESVFAAVVDKNAYTWNAMIGAYVRNRKEREAIDLFHSMCAESDVVPTGPTLGLVVTACGKIRSLAEAETVHRAIVKSGVKYGVLLETEIASMYAKCGKLDVARRVFEEIADKDVVAWNAMISGYAQQGHYREALDLYNAMISEAQVNPNDVTFTVALSACSSIGSLKEGLEIHARLRYCGESKSSVRVLNSLMAMYSRCKDLAMVKRVFEKMKKRDVVSWTTIISAYVHHSQAREALDMFERMNSEGVQADAVTLATVATACAMLGSLRECRRAHSKIIATGCQFDSVVQNAMINMYSKCGSVADARVVFDAMEKKNLVSWTTMITAYSNIPGNILLQREAIVLYDRMEVECSVQANEITFAAVLAACGSVGDVEKGRKVHDRINRCKWLRGNVFAMNAVMGMYAKCGDVMSVRRVFNGLDEAKRDVATWTIMIVALVEAGMKQQALCVYERMHACGVKADAVTFAAVVGVCDDLSVGKMLHERVVAAGLDGDVRLQNALIHMYGKCGEADVARRIFDGIIGERTVVTWTSMIGAYAAVGGGGGGREAVGLYREMECEGICPNEVVFVMVMMACSRSGMLMEGRDCFRVMMSDHDEMSPWKEHYNCMVDLLGRSGCVKESEELVECMPFEGDDVSWMTVASARTIN